ISKQLKLASLAAVAATSVMAVGSATGALAHNHGHKMVKTAEQPNIVETAQSTGVHGTLVAAVTAAGLGDTLSNGGPFTVFAPTDTAFAKLPEGTVATLVKPENKEALTGILTYHVVGGNITAEMIVGYIKGSKDGVARIKTLAGGVLQARLSGDIVVVTDGAGRAAAVTQADVKTSNGIIHVTDGVFLPN
ncbi:MAG: fasciclin domain-containing protein, partial [Marinomonas sp.]